MADCQEWKGQRFKKIYVRKTTQHEEKFFKLSFKGMIRFDLNMEHDEVYGKFVLTVCTCSIIGSPYVHSRTQSVYIKIT